MTYYLRTLNPKDRGNRKKDILQEFDDLFDAVEALKKIDEYNTPLVYLTKRKPHDYNDLKQNS